MKKVILLCLSAITILSGCYYDNYKELYPAASLVNMCDTIDAVTYSTQVANVVNQYCINCHSSGAANGNIRLDTRDGVINADQLGKLLPAINHTGPYPMPPGTQLDTCSIREIELWIQNNYAL